MDSSKTVTIIAPAGGRKNFVAFDVPMHKLANYSSIAKNAYFPSESSKDPVGDNEKRRVTRSEFDLGEAMHEGHARTMATFIKKSDDKEPALISIDIFGNNRTLEELVDIWRVIIYGYKVPKHMDDGSIRDTLRRRIYTKPDFNTADFKYVVENLNYDKGMVHTVLDHAATMHYKGKLPEEVRTGIDAYCKSIPTLWDQLLETADRVIKKEHAKADEREAKRKANEEAREKNANGGKKDDQAKAKDKAKAKKVVVPFVRKDGDFPPLS